MFQLPDSQIESTRLGLDADADALRDALAAITSAEAAATTLTLSARRHATAVAADDAVSLLSVAADELRGALKLLGQVEDVDLATECRDRADAAWSEIGRVA